jgi:hypothetical protein
MTTLRTVISCRFLCTEDNQRITTTTHKLPKGEYLLRVGTDSSAGQVTSVAAAGTRGLATAKQPEQPDRGFVLNRAAKVRLAIHTLGRSCIGQHVSGSISEIIP